jgi:hypothetical protein
MHNSIKEVTAMLEPEQEFDYEQKCEQIAMQIEMFVLDRIIAALERLNYILQPVDMKNQKPSKNTEPF